MIFTNSLAGLTMLPPKTGVQIGFGYDAYFKVTSPRKPFTMVGWSLSSCRIRVEDDVALQQICVVADKISSASQFLLRLQDERVDGQVAGLPARSSAKMTDTIDLSYPKRRRRKGIAADVRLKGRRGPGIQDPVGRHSAVNEDGFASGLHARFRQKRPDANQLIDGSRIHADTLKIGLG